MSWQTGSAISPAREIASCTQPALQPSNPTNSTLILAGGYSTYNDGQFLTQILLPLCLCETQ